MFFPIKHGNYWKGLAELCGMIRHCSEMGFTVLFHCNQGQVRAPTALALLLGTVCGNHPANWLPTIALKRFIAKFLLRFYHEVRINKNSLWCPPDFDDYILCMRLDNRVASLKDFRSVMHIVTSQPGTPRTIATRYEAYEEKHYAATPLNQAGDDIRD